MAAWIVPPLIPGEEQVAIVAGFGSFTLTARKYRGPDGAVRSEGFLLRESYSISVASMAVSRDGRGRFASAGVALIDGTDLVVAVKDRIAGFWTFNACEDFVILETCRGECGRGVVTHGLPLAH